MSRHAVSFLQEENPSRESTIVRTGGKLTPFSFNRTPEVGDHNDRMASKRRQKKYNLKTDKSLPPESFCLICSSPLKKSNNEETSAEIYAAACSSCQFQILPKDTASVNNFLSLLPQSMTIKDNSDSHEFLRCILLLVFIIYIYRLVPYLIIVGIFVTYMHPFS